MTQSSWVNPNGLPADEQITSARDLAILARALIHDFPEYDMYWHIPAIQLGKRTMRNFNTLIGRYDGADGMKTGFICASGFNLVATATRNGKRLIAVVLGAPSSPYRAAKAAGLLERGFHRGPLSWLTPSLGTVDKLQPINATPPDLRDEMCGPHRKRPAAEEADDDSDTSELHALEPAAERRQVLGAAQGPARHHQGDRGVRRRGKGRRQKQLAAAKTLPRSSWPTPAPRSRSSPRARLKATTQGRHQGRRSGPAGHRRQGGRHRAAAARGAHAARRHRRRQRVDADELCALGQGRRTRAADRDAGRQARYQTGGQKNRHQGG